MDALRTVLAPNPSPMTLDGTRTFVVGRSRPVVIDPGPALEAHLAAVLQALGGATPSAILLTHAHADHAAAAPALARRTGAPLCMGRGALEPGTPAEAVDRWLDDDERVDSDAGALRAVATPGHAPEHLSFLWRPEGGATGGALFVGDLFMGEGDTTLVAPPEGDLTLYLASLERVERLAPDVLLPSHGPPLDDALEAVGRFRQHRVQRIEQVRAALCAEPDAPPAALVERIYGTGLDPALRGAAEGSVRAILRHLARGEAH